MLSPAQKVQLKARLDREARQRAKGKLNPALRVQLAREANETCTYCGQRGTLLLGPDGTAWNLDHIVPISRNGWLGVENVALSCRPCNLSKGNKTLEEWRAKTGSA